MEMTELDALRRTVQVGDASVSYVDAGEGPPALFVHGAFLHAGVWRGVIEAVRDVRRCIAPDLLAHGATEEAPDADVSPGAQAEMLRGLCDALGLDAVDLVGNDSGGAVAQIFAARYPDRVRTLTLTNCDVHTNFPPAAFEPVAKAAEAGVLSMAIQAMVEDPEIARSPNGLGGTLEHPERLSDEVARSYLAPLVRTPERARTFERFVTGMGGGALVAVEAQLRALEAPTLIVWGTGDQFFDRSWAQWLREAIPGATDVVEIEGAKLFFPEERGAELGAHLVRHWAAAPVG